MKLSTFSRFFANLGLGRTERKAPRRSKRRPAEKLTLEFLEDRTLLSTTPAPIVTNPNTSPIVATTGFAPSSGFDPQVVMDPLNSQNLVEVQTTGSSLVGNFSTDGGQSWKGFTFADSNLGATGKVLDPTTTFPEVVYPDVTSPSVTFDRNGNFYVVSNQFNAAALTQASSAADLAGGTNVANASGAIVFDSFNFATVAAGLGGGENITNTILYQWVGQDPAFNPTVAVDTNLPATLNTGTGLFTNPSFTDPTTNATQTDTMAVMIDPTTGAPSNGANAVPKGIYVGWNINFTEPEFRGGSPAAVSRIMIAASGDGGKNFTTNQYADTAGSGVVTPVITGNNTIVDIGTGVGAAPQFVFTQGSPVVGNAAPTVAGGQLNVVYNTIGGGAADIQQSQPDGGVAANDVAAATTVSYNTQTQPTTIADGNPAGFETLTLNLVGDAMPTPGTTDGLKVGESQMEVSVPTGSQLPADGTTLTIDPGQPNAENVVVQSVSTQEADGDFIIGLTTAVTKSHNSGEPITFQVQTSAATSQATDFSLNVKTTAFPADFTTIDDLEVTVAMVHPHMDQVSIVLIPPPGSGLADITLLANFENTNGSTNFAQGLPDLPNLGVVANPTVRPNEVNTVGTVFDSDAPRAINSENDNTSTTPWIGHFRPEAGSLNEVDGLTAAQVAGLWTLQVTDFVGDNTNPPPDQFLTEFSMHFTSLISTTGFGAGADTTTGGGGPGGATGDPSYTENGATQNLALPGALTGSPSNIYPTNLGGPTNFASGTVGAGPGLVAAIDNTLGSFSPFQSRLYLAYSTGTNVELIHSDSDGASFSGDVQVNDDSITDNFSEGSRPEFMPSLTVDPVTGTVIVMYYDTRFDAAQARPANSIAYSVDGGDDFSASATLNQLQTATDEVTGNNVVVSPVPGNTTAAGTFGFGDRQGLVAYDGSVLSLFSSNLNAGGSVIMTADVSIPSGPTVVTGDMGPVAADFNYTPTVYADSVNARAAYVPVTYNNVFAADGTRELDQFVVTFDRPIDVSTFSTSQIQVYFRDPEGDAAVSIQVQSIQALDNHTLFGPDLVGFFNGAFTLATQFLITLVAPQSAVGTYSYAIGLNPNFTTVSGDVLLSDDIRSIPTGIALLHAGPTETTANQNGGQNVLLGTYMNQNQNALTNVNQVVGVNTTTPIESTSTPTAVPNGGATTPSTIAINDPYQQVRQDYYDPIELRVDIGTETWTLAAPITTTTQSTLTIAVGGPAAPTVPFFITIDSEELKVTGVSGTTWTVTRGQGGTTAATHNNGATLFYASSVPLTVSLTSADGTTINLGTATFNPKSGLATIIFADYKPYKILNPNGTTVTIQTPLAPLFAQLLNQGVNGAWTLNLTNSGGAPVTLDDWFLSVPRTTNAFAVPNPVSGMPFNFPYSNNTLPLIIPGPHVVSTAVVSTGTYNTVSTYTTTGPTQNNISVNLAAGASSMPRQFLLPVPDTVNVTNTSDAAAASNAYQIQQTGTNHIEVNVDLALASAENLTIQLVAQDGTTVTLYDGMVTPTAGIAAYTFDDFAPTPSTSFTPTATTLPVTPLAALINDNTAGDWQLVITNNGGSSASLIVTDWALQLPHTTGDNEVLNGTASGLLVTFDRNINPTSFTSADIVQMLDPIGTPIGGSPVINPSDFTVIADPAGTPAALAQRVFEVTFPTEQLNGTYNLTLAPGIMDTHGNAIDTNLNAGVDVLNGTNSTNTVTTFLQQSTNGNLNLALPAGQTVTSDIPIAQAFEILQDQGESWSLASTLGQSATTLTVTSNTSSTFMQPPTTPFTVTIDSEEMTITAVNGTTWTIGQRGVNSTTQTTHAAGATVFTTGHHIQVTVNIQAATGASLQSSDLQAQLIAPDGTVIQLFTNVGTGLGTTQGFASTTFDDYSTTPIQNGTPPYSNLTGTYDPQEPLSVLIGKSTAGIWQLRITNTATNGDEGALENWDLVLPHATPDTNLGETQADQISTSFRIFTQDPTNALTQQQWTAVGPAADNNGANSGPINAIAVDPSDPSGNTVYVAAASGGLWKTTNFLTTNPLGPTYIPLTNLGPTGSLNISSIAVFAKNNDPAQSYIYAITGNPNNDNPAIPGNIGYPQTNTAPDVGNPVDLTSGIGIIRSDDGGQTWEILDSSHNFYDPANDGSGGVGNATLDDQPLPEDAVAANQRDHFFVGLVGAKVTVDPTPLPNGNIVVYAAFSSGPNNANGGLYRSVDGGADWTLAPAPDAVTGKTDLFTGTATAIKTGNATDVVLAAGSSDVNGNLQQLYAAFQGDGVYGTTSATSATTLSELTGNTTGQLPSLQNVDSGYRFPKTVTIANTPSPNGSNGRIVLAAPALTPSPLENSFYEGWLYAAVANAGGNGLVGLYVTKDFGANWTQIQLPEVTTSQPVYGTNNTSRPDNNTLLDPNSEFASNAGLNDQITGITYMSLTVDPTNPNIVYLGGAGYNLLRIDITNLADAYAAVPYTNIAPDTGTTQFSTSDVGRATLDPPPTGAGPGGKFGVYDTLTPNQPLTNPATYPLEQGPSGSYGYYNLLRDPANPFPGATQSSTVQLANIIQIQNQGTGVLWGELGNLTNSLGDGILGNEPDPITGNANATLTNSIDIRSLVAIRDPLTGETRLLIGDDNGVFTGAARSSTQLQDNVGTADEVIGSRNGNIQVADMTDSASQPSSLAANIAGALFYGSSQFNNGFPSSSPNILDTGNLNWTGLNTYPSSNAPSYFGNGTAVATDLTGTGQLYQYRWAELLGNGINQAPRIYTDFFLVTPPQGSLTSRTFGLTPTDQNQWPSQGGSRFAVNPVDPTGIVMSSQTGVIYRSYGTVQQGGTGINWHQIGNFTASYGDALAFGAPNPSVDSNNDDFIYDGTVGGQVWVTFNGGTSAWTNITANLDGSAIEQIVTDPHQGTHDLYVVTQKGVYYMTDSNSQVDFGTAPTWTNITGNLFTLERSLFDNPHNPNDLASTLTDLTSLTADWRFAVPNNDTAIPTTAQSKFLPVLYVGGNGGVFQLLPNSVGGKTWTYYPDMTDTWALAAPITSATATTLTIASGGSADPSPGTTITIDNELMTVTATGGNNGLTWTVVRGVGGTTATTHAVTAAITHSGDNAVEEGGNLPNLQVTSLQLVTGNINPLTGLPNESTGYNMLLASTYGQGDFAIRLDNSAIQQYAVAPPTISFAGPTVSSVAPVPATGGTVLTGATVTFNTAVPVDPQTALKTSDYTVFDPNGNPVAVASVTDVTPTPTGGANPHNVYQITFLHPQTLFGTYRIMISGASDNAGDLMTPYNGSFQFPYSPSEVAASFPTYGIYGFRPATGFQQLNTSTATLLAVDANGDVAAEFANNGGVWLYTQATQTWRQLTPSNASALAITTVTPPTGATTIYVFAYLADGYVYQYSSTTGAFTKLVVTGTNSSAPPVATLLTADGNGDVFASFNAASGVHAGVYEFAAGGNTWTLLNGNVAGALAADAAGDVFLYLINSSGAGLGLYKYTAGQGIGNSPFDGHNVNLLAVDAAGDVAATFQGLNGTFEALAGATGFNDSQPVAGATASELAIGGSGDVFAVLSDNNVWEISNDGANIRQLTVPANSVTLPGMDQAGDLFGDVSGQGVWRDSLANGWQQLKTSSASLLAEDAAGDVAADFSGAGVYLYTASTHTWSQIAQSDVSLMVMDSAGDIYVEDPGYGLYVHPAGYSGFLQRMNTSDATLLAVNASGDLAVDIAGGLYRYIAGQGFGPEVNGNNATVLAIDANGDIFANQVNSAGAGLGLYRYINGGGGQLINGNKATQLAVDTAGDIFVEFNNATGVYRSTFANPTGFQQIAQSNASLVTDDIFGDVFLDYPGYAYFEYTAGAGLQLLPGTEGHPTVLA